MKTKLSIFLVVVMLITVMLFSFAPAALAASYEEELQPVSAESSNGEIVPFADERVYFYRTYNGYKQYRVWSLTREVWVTDWITYGTV